MKTKIGRPTDSKKDCIIKVRADEQTVRMLEYCSRATEKTKSDFVRSLIEDYYKKVKE